MELDYKDNAGVNYRERKTTSVMAYAKTKPPHSIMEIPTQQTKLPQFAA